MERPHLVIARAGSQSLHQCWLNAQQDRNWDLYLSPYQVFPGSVASGIVMGDVIAGPKWTGLRKLLHEWQGWREYERIWLPDDDLLIAQESLNRMFEFSTSLGLDLCAPALHENSYYAHFSTMRNRRCVARRTGFVEIMAPCFSAKALAQLLWTLDLSPSGWGWGLDSLWPKLLDYRNVGVIDTTPVLHTRPVGMFRDAQLGKAVRAESDAIMQTYQCGQVHTTFGIVGEDLQGHVESQELTAATLVEGWRYLWRAQPEVLPWIMEAQRPAQGWNAYPIAGVPSCAMI